ncbi:MAG: aminotransferase class V-fold PLP-dependent enzyme, partial [Pseudomonadota bacterium]
AGARLATGCGYKFLNGGPGAPSFIYASEDIADRLVTPLPGWMGHAAPFDFSADYAPKAGAARFAAGTPPILSLTAMNGALEIFEDIDVAALERKAMRLGDLCLQRAAALGLSSISPPIGARRGGHVSLIHDEGYAIVQALINDNVIGDFRAPNIMRFGFSPLIVRYTDVWDAMDRLAHILETRAWDRPEFKRRAAVT